MNKCVHKLSVVIASVNGFPIIGECLDSLHKQSVAGELEVVVANRCRNGVGIAIQQRYPWVKLVEASPQTTIPRLRAMAFQETTSDVVAVLEDHCIVEVDWAKRLIDAHRSNYPVIGGSIENAACERLIDWAAFFCEYSQAMKPMPEGEAENVTGNNVAYKKWVLKRFWRLIESGVWDSVLHENIKNARIPLYVIPSLTVYHKMSANLHWFIVQKFYFARSFSSMRFTESSWLLRLAYGVGSVILPVIIAFRTVAEVWKKGVHRRALILSFPFLMLLLFSWGIGETTGYLFGPGSSHAKVC